MAKMRGAIVVDIERCKGCNLCAVACPLNLVKLSATVNHKGSTTLSRQTGRNATDAQAAQSSALTDASLFIEKRRIKDGRQKEYCIAERQ